jgi:acylphosphatase
VKLAYRLMISGRVQGVGYRDSMVAQAQALGVTGWVQNLQSGEVQAHIEGDARQLEKLIAWCHRGPSFASVETVRNEVTEPIQSKSFERRPTA